MISKKLFIAALLAFTISGGTLACAGDKPATGNTVQMTVTEKGFQPKRIQVKNGEPVNLIITRKTEQTCATSIVIDEYGIHTEMPLNTAVTVTFTPTKSGEIKYGCAMGKMVSGILLVE